MTNIKILVCDDHEILRKGIVELLNLQEGMEVIGEAVNGLEAVTHTEKLEPDVVLMDIQMPDYNGLEAVKKIREQNQEVKIIMLTVSDEEKDLYTSIKNGANGYLLKNMNLNDLFAHIHGVLKGEASFSPGLANKLLYEFKSMAERLQSQKGSQYNLSDREMDVLELVVKGYSNEEIGDLLFISQHTVKKHLGNILQKLHVKNRYQAANFAVKEGLIDDQE
ncbi:response regulator [Salimicrobium flavidum]|uniref:Two component transcriptional regulator, LuxR family n=1 Tax=Salimicrobium flavidum TaxID=570947 RepID=A0A1N7KSJ8_9BACI|nr:response regulator transcription factor [Salimicrobium flavidum]SIS64569.1 two component transcriptional regulator, LuxR family [Salimicrobium flavidum]